MSKEYEPIPQVPQGQAQLLPPTIPQQVIPQPNEYIQPQNQPQSVPNQPISQMSTIPNSNIGGIQYVYVPDPMAELAYSTSVLIRQQPQFMEQITNCESPNRYFIFSQSPQGGMKLLFKCKEFSGFCMRNCCPADSREFNMVIKHIASSINMDENFSIPFINIRRPFKCTCCCLERPEMLITFGAKNEPFGRIKQPFTCCDPEFSLYDNNGIKKYFIHGDCCQCGFICRNNFCGKLSEAVFNIYNEGDRATPIGSIIKKKATVSEIMTSADSYQVNFPVSSSPQDKVLLMVAGLMIDYQFFEEKASEDNGNGFHISYSNI